MLLGDLVRRNARRYPRETALVSGSTSLSFDELNRRVNGIAHALLGLGLQRDDKVAILLDNCHQYLELYFAIPQAGGVAVPINAALSGQEMTYIINNAGAKILVFGERFTAAVDVLRPQLTLVKKLVVVGAPAVGATSYEELVAQYPVTEPEVVANEQDVVYLLYTSGTTGLPKGIMVTHRGLLESVLNYVLGCRLRQEDIGMVTTPFFWAASIVLGFMPQFYVGGKVVIADTFTPEAILKLIQQEKVTTCLLTPPTIVSMLEHPQLRRYDFSSLRHVWFSGVPMPLKTLERALQTFGNILFQVYGMVECTPLTIVVAEEQILDGSPRSIKRLASCGREGTNVEVRVVDDEGKDVAPGQVGEVIGRGDNLMRGYWKMPQATEEALRGGYMHTGDLATRDEDGYVYLVGRKKDLIVSSGQTVYAVNVEEVLYQYPDVVEASAIGVPDAKLGEAVKAVVVIRRGHKVTAADIIEFCRQRLPGYACPAIVAFMDKLPRNASGKVLKRVLREGT